MTCLTPVRKTQTGQTHHGNGGAMGKRLSKAEQGEIVTQLAVNIESLTEDEFQELYDQLDVDHQIEVNGNVREFADRAVGDEHWDSDN
jgi:hypothetical protein